jgi:5-(carboxyamino)imidazole ribonucleotide mutase
MADATAPLVGVIMGSKSDWDTMKAASDALKEFGVPHECRVISAHRTPDLSAEYAKGAASRGMEVIICGAGGAAHLAGVFAAMTPLPVLGVPIQSKSLQGLDSLLSMVQMPGGIPVGTLAIGTAGAKNAGLFAVRILANCRPELRDKLKSYHERMAAEVEAQTLQ